MHISDGVIRPDELRSALEDNAAGAYASFEGWIRNENEGRRVLRLEYEAYEPLCVSEGQRIIDEVTSRLPILHARCVHRTGLLEIGECAVWVGVSSPHRDEAFEGCRFIIDQVKVRLPIWKKEHYADGDSGWVNCERCATHGIARPG
jgi:molybdopterin synthase catalytic subunit